MQIGYLQVICDLRRTIVVQLVFLSSFALD